MKQTRLISIVLLALAGCGTAVSNGHSTSLDSVDLIKMTDDMARSIVASPAVQQAIATHGSLKIVVQPVVNQMRAEVLPIGQEDAFTGRVRTLLAQHDRQQFTWIMNLLAFHRLRSHELDNIDPGPPAGEVSPGYALTATFTSLADENGSGRSDYYVCNYTLTNLKDRTTLWSKSYEVQKRTVRGFLD